MSISYDEHDAERVKTIPAFKAQILGRIARMDAVMPITAGGARHEIELEHEVLQWVLSHLEDIDYASKYSSPTDNVAKMKMDLSAILQKY